MRWFYSLALISLSVLWQIHALDSNSFVVIDPNYASIFNVGNLSWLHWQNVTANAITIWLYEDKQGVLEQSELIKGKASNSTYASWIPPSDTPSGCNYTVLLSDGVGRVFSDFFQINNQQDGGLPLNRSCPLRSPPTPKDALTASTAAPTVISSEASTSGPQNSSEGYSPGTLGGAIAGSIIGTLAVVALGFYLFYRRHNSTRKKEPGDAIFEISDGIYHKDVPEISSTEVHQLEGSPVAESTGAVSQGISNSRVAKQ